MIFGRLAGLETEYAVRSPSASSARVIQRILEALGQATTTASAKTLMWTTRMFCANGGAFYHEAQASSAEGGLIEGATPECQSPLQLLTFQRAQERLLAEALAAINERDGAQGRYSIGLLKNSRDAVGNTYGVQENYEALVATGWRLIAYRAGLIALFPMFLLGWTAAWLLVVAIFSLMIPWVIAAIVEGVTERDLGSDRFIDWLSDSAPVIDRILGRVILGVPLFGLFLLMRAVAFHEVRAQMTAYLVSRTVFTGAGALEDDGTFHISERKSAIVGVSPMRLMTGGVYIYWFSNFAKRAIAPCFFQFQYLGSLFARRQRLQIALSDSNGCEEAEYLKLGTAMLVLDAIETGGLHGAPRLISPVEALHAIGSDESLQAVVETSHGRMTGLEIQRWYCDNVGEFVQKATTVPMEAASIVRSWSDALDSLARDPEELVGRVDWVTKRFLLETAGADANHDSRKKIDLRYHELGSGYLAQMASEGLVVRVTEDEDVASAMQSPPRDTPAAQRSRYVHAVARNELDARIDWQQVRIRRGRFGAEVIRLDDYRKR